MVQTRPGEGAHWSPPLAPAEKMEIAGLESWLADKSHVDDPVLAEFCAEPVVDVSPAPPAQVHEDLAEHRKRLVAEGQAVAAGKVLPLPDKDEASPQPD
jgi:hypothetical protein